jgi:ferredoxin
MAVFYRRRAFCLLVCPIGALTGLYAMTAVSEVRTRGGTCDGCPQLCYRRRDDNGCAMYEFPRTMDTNRNCNMCAQCITGCPQDNLTWRLRPPGRELWGLRRPLTAEALLVVLLVALVYIQTVDMTTAWGSYVKRVIEAGLAESYNMVLVGTFLAGSLLVLGVYMAVSRISASGGPWARNAARYGYAYLPVVLSVHLAHNAGHLVSEGGIALRTSLSNVYSLIGLTYTVDYGTGSPGFSMPWMMGLVVVGGLFSMYSAWRVGQGMEHKGKAPRLLPHIVLLVLLTALFVHLFLLPMNPRHTH